MSTYKRLRSDVEYIELRQPDSGSSSLMARVPGAYRRKLLTVLPVSPKIGAAYTKSRSMVRGCQQAVVDPTSNRTNLSIRLYELSAIAS